MVFETLRDTQTTSTAARMLRIGIAVVALCISAGISIPLQPVPFTLQVLVLGVIVATLPAGEAVCATAAYVAIGALGAPVFSGYMGGIAKLLGPSGGFVYDFVAAACVGTLVRGALERTRLPRTLVLFASVLGAFVVAYVFGWLHLMLVMQLSPVAAFALGCAPFILADIVKAALAVAIAHPLRRRIS